MLGQPTAEMQELPVNLFEQGGKLIAVVPMPALTSDEIQVQVTDDELVIEGRLRGRRQGERRYLLDEWRYGSFLRRIQLPFAVDVARANATHGNGVLTVALPRDEQPGPGMISLKRDAGSRHHQYRGHAGRGGLPIHG